MAWSERLSPLDAAFLDLERERSAHMHVGMVAVFEGPAPSYRDLVSLIEARLDQVPRYRQRLAFVPMNLGRPVWVDEAQLDIEHHVRHTALPRPGGETQLKRLAARLFSQRLDHDKPLWELWMAEGLDDGRFAIVAKTHHCMIDGISGVDIASVILASEPDPTVPAPASRWKPRPAPSTRELIRDAIAYQVSHPISVARDALRPGTPARRLLLEVAGGLPELVKLARSGQAPETSLNQPIGPHRRFETVKIDLGAIKRVRAALGGTVNDVILAVVAGALRRLLESRGEPLADLRVMIPVSVRSQDQRGKLGNQVTAVFCPLPVGEPDPRERLARVSAETRGLKESRQAVGALALTRLGEFTPPTLAAQAARLQTVTRFFNLVVTNVPGPQHPLYLLGRRMIASYPCLPLAAQTTLGVALLSYDGTIGIGLLGDADKARDLAVLADAVPRALDELVELAGKSLSRDQPRTTA